MASGGMKREISETHDALRFGINAGVKADLAPPHPLQSTIQSVRTHLSSVFRAIETLTLNLGVWGTRSRAGGQVLGGQEEVRDGGYLRIRLQHPQGSRCPNPLQVLHCPWQFPPKFVVTSINSFELRVCSR